MASKRGSLANGRSAILSIGGELLRRVNRCDARKAKTCRCADRSRSERLGWQTGCALQCSYEETARISRLESSVYRWLGARHSDSYCVCPFYAPDIRCG